MLFTCHPALGIRSLSENDRGRIGKSYEELLRLGAGLNFQETAAAKALHALRPEALPIWDAAIRDWFIGKNGFSNKTAGSIYAEFLSHVAEEISDLESDLKCPGYSLIEIPQLVHGSGGWLVKLVDEYYCAE